jgi:hypothetical protein
MNPSPPKRVAWEKQQPARRSRPNLSAIHDGPHVFRVTSHRSSSTRRDDDASDLSSDRDKAHKRFTSIPSARDPPYCNWKNFMKRKSRYGKCSLSSFRPLRSFESGRGAAIQSLHALCYLTPDEQEIEPRPSFINYGGHYGSAECGHKRTFNALAVHVGFIHGNVFGKQMLSFFSLL